MEHLTKQQIVLVTLLVSFVTSIATGIFTVSLMDQAPPVVTQTIDRVVERTVEKVVPTPSQSASVSDSASSASTVTKAIDQIANTIEQSSKGLVQIKRLADPSAPEQITGFGIIVSKEGAVITDKASIAFLGNYVAVFSNKVEVPVRLVQSQNNGDIAFLIAEVPPAKKKDVVFTPVSIGKPSLRLGETVYAIGGDQSFTLVQGFISDTNTTDIIHTSISPKKVTIGSPLISSTGEFIGMKTASLDTTDSASFYPLILAKDAIPKMNQ